MSQPRYCYPCIVEIASMTGNPAVGNADGDGRCSTCKCYRRLYRTVDLKFQAAETPFPTLRKHARYSPTPILFGWSLVLLAVALAIAVFLTARCSEGAPQTLLDFTQAAIRRLPIHFEDRAPEVQEAKQAQLSAIAAEGTHENSEGIRQRCSAGQR